MGSHTTRKKASHYPSGTEAEQTSARIEKYGYDYLEYAHHPRLKHLANRVVAQAASELLVERVSVFQAGPLLISTIDATYELQTRVVNGLVELGVGIDEYLHCAVDCVKQWSMELGRAVPHTTVYTLVR